MALQTVPINYVGVRPLVVGLVFIVLATIAVMLRLVSCRLSPRNLYPDDYMICLALVSKFRIP
jgi:hypothetical protein